MGAKETKINPEAGEVIPQKKEELKYPLHPLIATRRSPYAFADTPVEQEKLQSCFEAARWAPSSYNEQPWRFVVVTKEDGELYTKLFESLVEFNQGWVKAAPVLLLTVTRSKFGHNENPNSHARHDVGLAMGNFLAQATHLGLSVHQMSGFDTEKARVAARLPAEYEPVAMAAIGYLGEPTTLPEFLQQRETGIRQRKELKDLVFLGEFGKTIEL